MQSATQLIQAARNDCAAVAEGEFTPVVFKWHDGFDGKYWQIAFVSTTADGRGCIVWL